jgi:hypothetical protein
MWREVLEGLRTFPSIDQKEYKFPTAPMTWPRNGVGKSLPYPGATSNKKHSKEI